MLGKEEECLKFSRPLKVFAFQSLSRRPLSGYCPLRNSGIIVRAGPWLNGPGGRTSLLPSAPFPRLWTHFLSPPPYVPCFVLGMVGGEGAIEEQKPTWCTCSLNLPGRQGGVCDTSNGTRGSGKGIICILGIFRNPHLGMRLLASSMSPPTLFPSSPRWPSPAWPPHFSLHQRLPTSSSLRLLLQEVSERPLWIARSPSPLPMQ